MFIKLKQGGKRETERGIISTLLLRNRKMQRVSMEL